MPRRNNGLPCNVDILPDLGPYYQGLAHQDLPFHYALAELIDNSFSAYDSEPKIVEVHIQKFPDKVTLKVADKARGISLSDLKNKILRVGGQGHIGVMNEHGYGLKNALCVLTQNNRDWTIITRDEELNEQDLIVKVKGPFRTGIQAEEAGEEEWLEDVTHAAGNTGTRVFVETTYDYFAQIYPRNWRVFDRLIIRLLEHLGVMYRGYLEDRRNNIIVKYREVFLDTPEWQEHSVQPIKITDLCENSESHNLSITHGGRIYPFVYLKGEISPTKVASGSRGIPFPLKIYYQCNQKTQGIDIRIRGKVIMNHQLEYIWQDIERHNSLNKFTGEIIVDDPDFKTVNNKSKLSPQDPKWDLIRQVLDEEEFKPSRSAMVRTEDSIRERLIEQLKHNIPDSVVTPNYPTWEGAGVLIDIHLKHPGDRIWIYELKKGSVEPLDVYQLVMYWDGKVRAGQPPEKGFLVGSNCPPSVSTMIEYWNQRRDAKNNHYKLYFKTIDELMPPR